MAKGGSALVERDGGRDATYRVGGNVVVIDETHRTVTTTFADGHQLIAVPNYTEEDVARANALGYDGEDPVWAMTRHHDLIHSLLAEARGEPWSGALHGAATGSGCAGGNDEERIVFLIQRMLNVGLDVAA